MGQGQHTVLAVVPQVQGTRHSSYVRAVGRVVGFVAKTGWALEMSDAQRY